MDNGLIFPYQPARSIRTRRSIEGGRPARSGRPARARTFMIPKPSRVETRKTVRGRTGCPAARPGPTWTWFVGCARRYPAWSPTRRPTNASTPSRSGQTRGREPVAIVRFFFAFGFFELDMLAGDGIIFLERQLLGLGPRVLLRHIEIARVGARQELDLDHCGLGHGLCPLEPSGFAPSSPCLNPAAVPTGSRREKSWRGANRPKCLRTIRIGLSLSRMGGSDPP